MRALFSFLVVLAFAAPSFAAETPDAQKPVLIKGSKSYQIRYPSPASSPDSIEPAAGVDVQQDGSESQTAVAPSEDEGKKMMKLHGKK